MRGCGVLGCGIVWDGMGRYGMVWDVCKITV